MLNCPILYRYCFTCAGLYSYCFTCIIRNTPVTSRNPVRRRTFNGPFHSVVFVIMTSTFKSVALVSPSLSILFYYTGARCYNFTQNKQWSHINFATEEFPPSNTTQLNTQCIRKRRILFKICLSTSRCALKISVGAWQISSYWTVAISR